MASAVGTAERPTAGPSDETPPEPAGDSPARRLLRSWVMGTAVLLVLLQLVVRGWVAATGNFFADDLVLEGLAASTPGLPLNYLIQGYDGHLMPGGFLIAKLVTAAAPLQWGAAAFSLLVLQALASLSVLRLLRALLGDRPALLLPLGLYLFSPLTLPSFAWWASALNAVPLQIALAWAAADAVHLVRTGRQRYAVSGTLAVAVGLAFFLKALIVPWVALAVVAVLGWLTGVEAPLRSALRRGQPLWWGSAVVTAVWAWIYTAQIGAAVVTETVPAGDAAFFVGRGLVRGVVPALLGGPWQWDRTTASAPWVRPPVELVVLAGLAATIAIVASIRNRRGAWLVWALVGTHVAVSTALMMLGRFTPQLADLLPLTLRHYSDCAVVVSAAVALVLRAPRRPRPAVLTPRGRGLLVPAAAALFVVSSLWSTLTFGRVWQHAPAGDYLATARASLAAAGPAPLLDQRVPDEVLWSAAAPHNLAGSVFAPLADRPPIGNWTWDLRMIDESGRVVPAEVAARRRFAPGAQPGCGYFIDPTAVTVVPLDEPIYPWDWTVRLDYLANRDGEIHVALSTGEGARALVRRGIGSIYLRLRGAGGDDIRVSTTTVGLGLCVTGGRVGLVEPTAGPR